VDINQTALRRCFYFLRTGDEGFQPPMGICFPPCFQVLVIQFFTRFAPDNGRYGGNVHGVVVPGISSARLQDTSCMYPSPGFYMSITMVYPPCRLVLHMGLDRKVIRVSVSVLHWMLITDYGYSGARRGNGNHVSGLQILPRCGF